MESYIFAIVFLCVTFPALWFIQKIQLQRDALSRRVFHRTRAYHQDVNSLIKTIDTLLNIDQLAKEDPHCSGTEERSRDDILKFAKRDRNRAINGLKRNLPALAAANCLQERSEQFDSREKHQILNKLQKQALDDLIDDEHAYSDPLNHSYNLNNPDIDPTGNIIPYTIRP